MRTKLPEYATDPEKAIDFFEKMGYFPSKYEKVFLRDAYCAYRYAILLDQRLPEYLEKVFLKCPESAYEYAVEILQDRLPEKIEKVFLDSAVHAYEYAENVIKGRLPEFLEKVFIKDVLYANLYAKNILRDQFSEELHNKILIIGVTNKEEQPNVAKYLKTCQEFQDIFINYIKEKNIYDDVVKYHIKDYWQKNKDMMSEYDQIIYNKLIKLNKNKKFKDIVNEQK